MAARIPEVLTALAASQDGVASRRQLRELGVSVSLETAQISAERWRACPPNAVVLHNGPVTRLQAFWVALLNAGEHAALCGRTALELTGLDGWSKPTIEVVVVRGTLVPTKPGVLVHESRRFDPQVDIHPARRPP